VIELSEIYFSLFDFALIDFDFLAKFFLMLVKTNKKSFKLKKIC
jgi:hypothetical protein